jgi:hypothetical protein
VSICGGSRFGCGRDDLSAIGGDGIRRADYGRSDVRWEEEPSYMEEDGRESETKKIEGEHPPQDGPDERRGGSYLKPTGDDYLWGSIPGQRSQQTEEATATEPPLGRHEEAHKATQRRDAKWLRVEVRSRCANRK